MKNFLKHYGNCVLTPFFTKNFITFVLKKKVPQALSIAARLVKGATVKKIGAKKGHFFTKKGAIKGQKKGAMR